MSLVRIQSLISLVGILLFCLLIWGCGKTDTSNNTTGTAFHIIQDEEAGTLSIFRQNSKEPVLTQNAQPGMRPYIHPIMAPDGKGALTEFSPGHHTHQTGLYWGFTRVNGTGAHQDTLKKWFYSRNRPPQVDQQIGRDFFHNNGDTHWKRVSAKVITSEGEQVQWQTVYHMLDEAGNPILEESANWSMHEREGKFRISLEWRGKALEDITVNEFSYGGLFLRMPWKEGSRRRGH